jgi:hypothetical protein
LRREQLDVESLLANPKVDCQHDQDGCGEGCEYHVVDRLDKKPLYNRHGRAPVEDSEDCTCGDADGETCYRDENTGEQLCAEDRPPMAATESQRSAYRLGSPDVLEHHDWHRQPRRDQEPYCCQEASYTEHQ